MNKPFLIAVIFIAIVVSAIVYTASDSDQISDEDETNGQTSQQSVESDSVQQSQQEHESARTNNTGAYVEYSEEALASADDTRILFFHAPWCPQCRAIDKDIQEQGVPAGYTIIKVDYDSNQDLRERYGVTVQTTLVKLDENSELVDKYVAYDDPSLDAIKRDFL